MRLISALRSTAAGVLASAALVLAPAPSAVAAECPSSTGVTVVVDFTALDGGVAVTCVEDGGGDKAADLFEVNHTLTRVQAYPGAVCRVDGAPSDLSCRNMPPQHYYWALYWSDPSGEQVYSSQGVDSLEVPDGGSVSFIFHKSDPPPSTSPSPSPGGSGGGSNGSGSESGSGSGSGSGSESGSGSGGSGGSSGDSSAETTSPTSSMQPSAAEADEPTDAAKESGRASRSPDDRVSPRGDRPQKERRDKQARDRPHEVDDLTEPSEDPSDAVPTATADPPPIADDGLPVWVAPLGIGGLFAAAGAVALLRRRSVV